MLAAFICSASASAATNEQYLACDGYPAPDGKKDFADGLRIDARSYEWHNPSYWVDSARSATVDNAEAVAACDAALAGTLPNHWVRKISLLQARALHRLYNNDTKAALADLDLAEAEGHKDDAFYARSLGLDLVMARAYVMRRAGDQVGAESLAMSALEARPFNRQYPALAIMAAGGAATLETKKRILRRLSAVQPSNIAVLFDAAFNSGDFAEAIALYPHLVPSLEIATDLYRKGEKAQLEWRNFRTVELFHAEYAGLNAYALAATGKSAEARAAMEAARARLSEKTAAPAPLTEKKARDREEASLHQGLVDTHSRVATEAAALLEDWNRLVEWRISVAEGKSAVVAATITAGNKLPLTMASAELLDAMTAQLPPALRPPPGLAADIRSKLGKNRGDRFPNEFPAALLKNMVAAEAFERLPPYEESSSFFAMEGSFADLNAEGWRASKPEPDGSIRVSYRGISGSRAMIEEFALLYAADLARQAGKKGIIVTDREDVTYTTGVTYMGYPGPASVNGSYARLNVRFVDLSALPTEYEGARWRVLDADAIYQTLAPLYLPKEEASASKKKKKT
jgi:hypothetical protein